MYHRAMRNASPDSPEIRRLVFLFGMAYFAQALAQAGGLIQQPLNNYLKQGLGFNAAQVADFLAILTLPWMIKPLYGLVSDYIPLFGYRRRTWLMLVNLLAAGGFLWLSGLRQSGLIAAALVMTAVGTAASDVIIDALMVENGERTGQTARFQGVQWIWFKVAAILTALGGGFLTQTFAPERALSLAALITLLAPVSVLLAATFIVREEKSALDFVQMRATTHSVVSAFRSPELRIAALFLALWCFSPGFGTPMYYHMTDRLGFEQGFIGQLEAFRAGGAVAGAFLYARYFSRTSISFRAVFAVVAASVAVLAYLSLAQPHVHAGRIAPALNIFVGMANQIGALTIFSIAARACPPRAEGFTFAALMSLYNGVDQFSSVIGGRLYHNVFGGAIAPLLWVAAGSLALCLFLVPLLKRLDQVHLVPEAFPVQAGTGRHAGDSFAFRNNEKHL